MSDQPVLPPLQLHLDFDAKTLDYIANVLGTRPYTEVAPVLQNIAAQVAGQQRAAAAMAGLQQGNGADAGQPLTQ